MLFVSQNVAAWLVCMVTAVVADSRFTAREYKSRLTSVQQMMKAEGLAAIFLTREGNHRYFAGIDTEFWISPTRSNFLIIPAEGQITAIVPTIMAELYEPLPTVGRVVTWSGLDPNDNGISLLVEELKRCAGSSAALFGSELGGEFAMRMPVGDYLRLNAILGASGHTFIDATLPLKKMFMVKSEEEIGAHRAACRIQSEVLHDVPNLISVGMTEKQVARRVRAEFMLRGSDNVPYMLVRSGVGGYTEIVGGATDRVLRDGDVLILDVGSVVDGYYCDCNRNYIIGNDAPAPNLQDAQIRLYRAIEAGIKEAREGATTASLFAAMKAVLDEGKPAQEEGSSVGRFGHAVGQEITTWPSILPNQAVPLQAGMVFALEPSMDINWNGRMLVHEEVIVVQPGGGPAQLLSTRAPQEFMRIAGERTV